MDNLNEETLAAVRVQEVAMVMPPSPNGYTLYHLDCLGNTPLARPAVFSCWTWKRWQISREGGRCQKWRQERDLRERQRSKRRAQLLFPDGTDGDHQANAMQLNKTVE